LANSDPPTASAGRGGRGMSADRAVATRSMAHTNPARAQDDFQRSIGEQARELLKRKPSVASPGAKELRKALWRPVHVGVRMPRDVQTSDFNP
jgi:hypothetical protein